MAEALTSDLLHSAMERLAVKRPIFHSEADFQHALAWEVQIAHPEAAIRLEKRMALEPSVQLDIVIDLDGRPMGVELKYLRRGMTAEIAGERFTLATGADDHGRYFAIADLARLERLLAAGVIDSGALVLLTNVANLWEAPNSGRRTLYQEFRVHDEHVLRGEMTWGQWGAAGGRPNPGAVSLMGTYPLSWRDYSTVGGAAFRYLLIAADGSKDPASG
jgi:hypothetical protein